ncbi:MAG: hypothetical protein WC721_15600 [Victivallaceae bacterium]|jgi:hypothetical protein
MESEVKSGNVVANVNYKIPESWKQDKYSWIYLGVLVIAIIAESFINANLGKLVLIANFAIMRSEEKLAAKDSMSLPSKWWCLIMPVYLWLRLTVLKQPRIHFWLWIGVLIGLSIILTCLSPE